MAGRLEGKKALVTGATSNIGRAIAEEFAAEGAYVVVSGRSGQRGGEVVDGIRSRGGRAEFVQANLDGSLKASRALAQKATSALGGRIDILVNNAGVYRASALDEKTFDQFFAVNVKAPFNAISPGVVFETVPGVAHPGEAVMKGTPAGRMGRPREIGQAAVYLAGDESAFVHGVVLPVDGGRSTVAVIARWPQKRLERQAESLRSAGTQQMPPLRRGRRPIDAGSRRRHRRLSPVRCTKSLDLQVHSRFRILIVRPGRTGRCRRRHNRLPTGTAESLPPRSPSKTRRTRSELGETTDD